MNVNARIKMFHQRQSQKKAVAVVVPQWSELSAMDNEQVQALADRLGIEWTGRMSTLSAINKSRG